MVDCDGAFLKSHTVCSVSAHFLHMPVFIFIDYLSNQINFSGKKLWKFSRFQSDCTVGHGHGSSFLGTSLDQKDYITDSCTQMMLELHQFYDPDKVCSRIFFQ